MPITRFKRYFSRKILAAGLAGLYAFTNVFAVHAAEKSFWQDRRSARSQRSPTLLAQASFSIPALPPPGQALGAAESPAAAKLKKLPLSFDLAAAVLPYGTIREVREGRPGAPLVLLLQDIHTDDAAQKNIGGVLSALAEGGVTLTAVEGAAGDLRFSAFRTHPSPSALAAAAEHFRAAGYLSGPEWAGLTSPKALTMVGVETAELYRANVDAAREALAGRPAAEALIHDLRAALDPLKGRIFSERLRSLDARSAAHRSGVQGLGEYARFLAEGLGAETPGQLRRFVRALEWEERLDPPRIERDRRALMEKLAAALDASSLEALVTQGVAYRAGRSTGGEFFTFLRRLCGGAGVELNAVPAFRDYLDYIGAVEGIDRAALLNEIDGAEEILARRWAPAEREKALWAAARDLDRLARLFGSVMSSEDWAAYGPRREAARRLPERLAALAPGTPPAAVRAEDIERVRRPYEEFCRIALARNDALAANALAEGRRRGAATVALVAGGFHTPGLLAALGARGCAAVVVTPRVEKTDGKPLDVFARDPLPLEKLFAGPRIGLAPEKLLSDPSALSPPMGNRAAALRTWLAAVANAVAARDGADSAALHVWTRGLQSIGLEVVDESAYRDKNGTGWAILTVRHGDGLLQLEALAAPPGRPPADGLESALLPDGGRLRYSGDALPSEAGLGFPRRWRAELSALLSSVKRRFGDGAAFPEALRSLETPASLVYLVLAALKRRGAGINADLIDKLTLFQARFGWEKGLHGRGPAADRSADAGRTSVRESVEEESLFRGLFVVALALLPDSFRLALLVVQAAGFGLLHYGRERERAGGDLTLWQYALGGLRSGSFINHALFGLLMGLPAFFFPQASLGVQLGLPILAHALNNLAVQRGWTGGGLLRLQSLGEPRGRRLFPLSLRGLRQRGTPAPAPRDPRPVRAGLLSADHVVYDEAVRRGLDPEGRRTVGLYLGGGADLSNFFLSTNVELVYFLSQNYGNGPRTRTVSPEDVRGVLYRRPWFYLQRPALWPGAWFRWRYARFKRAWGYANGQHLSTPAQFLAALTVELDALGVDRRAATPFKTAEGHLGLRFPWGHPGEPVRERTVVFLEGTATAASELERILAQLPLLDVVYQRAGALIPLKLEVDPRLVAMLNRRMAPGGRFALNPYARNWSLRHPIDRKIIFPFPLRAVDIPDEEALARRVIDRQRASAGARKIVRSGGPPWCPYGFRMRIWDANPGLDLPAAESSVPLFDSGLARDGTAVEATRRLAQVARTWTAAARTAVIELLVAGPTGAAVEPDVLEFLARHNPAHPRANDFSDLVPQDGRWDHGDPAVNFIEGRLRGRLADGADEPFLDRLKALLIFWAASHRVAAAGDARRRPAERLDDLHLQYVRLRLARALLAPPVGDPSDPAARALDRALARVRDAVEWTDRSMDYVDLAALLEDERVRLARETREWYVAVHLRISPEVRGWGSVFAYDGLLLYALRKLVEESTDLAGGAELSETDRIVVDVAATPAGEVRLDVRSTVPRAGARAWALDDRLRRALESVGGDWGPRDGRASQNAWVTLPVLKGPGLVPAWKSRPVIVVGGPDGARNEAVARSLASQLGLRYVRAGFVLRVILYELLTQHRGIDLNDPDRVARTVRSILAEVDLDSDPVRVRGKSTAAPDADGRSYRDRVRQRIDGSEEKTFLLDRVAGYPGVQEALVEKIRSTLPRAFKGYNGVVLVVARPSFRPEVAQGVAPFFLSPDDSRRAERTGVGPRRPATRDRQAGAADRYAPPVLVDANRSVYEIVRDIADRLRGEYQSEKAFYQEFVQRHGLQGGRGADIATSANYEPVLGLQEGGLKIVFAVDFLHPRPQRIAKGVWSIPGDATRLSETPEIGRDSMDLLVFNDGLQYILDPHYSFLAAHVRENPGAWDNDDGFTIRQDLLYKTLTEARAALRPGGRLLILWTAPQPADGSVADLFGNRPDNFLRFVGFEEAETRVLSPGRFTVTAVKPDPPADAQLLPQSLGDRALSRLRGRGPPVMGISLGSWAYGLLTVGAAPILEEMVFRSGVFHGAAAGLLAALFPLLGLDAGWVLAAQWFLAVPVFVLAHRLLHRESWADTLTRVLPAVLFTAVYAAAPGMELNALLHGLWNAGVLATGRGPLMAIPGAGDRPGPAPLFDFKRDRFNLDLFWGAVKGAARGTAVDIEGRRIAGAPFLVPGDWDGRGCPVEMRILLSFDVPPAAGAWIPRKTVAAFFGRMSQTLVESGGVSFVDTTYLDGGVETLLRLNSQGGRESKSVRLQIFATGEGPARAYAAALRPVNDGNFWAGVRGALRFARAFGDPALHRDWMVKYVQAVRLGRAGRFFKENPEFLALRREWHSHAALLERPSARPAGEEARLTAILQGALAELRAAAAPAAPVETLRNLRADTAGRRQFLDTVFASLAIDPATEDGALPTDFRAAVDGFNGRRWLFYPSAGGHADVWSADRGRYFRFVRLTGAPAFGLRLAWHPGEGLLLYADPPGGDPAVFAFRRYAETLAGARKTAVLSPIPSADFEALRARSAEWARRTRLSALLRDAIDPTLAETEEFRRGLEAFAAEGYEWKTYARQGTDRSRDRFFYVTLRPDQRMYFQSAAFGDRVRATPMKFPGEDLVLALAAPGRRTLTFSVGPAVGVPADKRGISAEELWTFDTPERAREELPAHLAFSAFLLRWGPRPAPVLAAELTDEALAAQNASPPVVRISAPGEAYDVYGPRTRRRLRFNGLPPGTYRPRMERDSLGLKVVFENANPAGPSIPYRVSTFPALGKVKKFYSSGESGVGRVDKSMLTKALEPLILWALTTEAGLGHHEPSDKRRDREAFNARGFTVTTDESGNLPFTFSGAVPAPRKVTAHKGTLSPGATYRITVEWVWGAGPLLVLARRGEAHALAFGRWRRARGTGQETVFLDAAARGTSPRGVLAALGLHPALLIRQAEQLLWAPTGKALADFRQRAERFNAAELPRNNDRNGWTSIDDPFDGIPWVFHQMGNTDLPFRRVVEFRPGLGPVLYFVYEGTKTLRSPRVKVFLDLYRMRALAGGSAKTDLWPYKKSPADDLESARAAVAERVAEVAADPVFGRGNDPNKAAVLRFLRLVANRWAETRSAVTPAPKVIPLWRPRGSPAVGGPMDHVVVQIPSAAHGTQWDTFAEVLAKSLGESRRIDVTTVKKGRLLLTARPLEPGDASYRCVVHFTGDRFFDYLCELLREWLAEASESRRIALRLGNRGELGGAHAGMVNALRHLRVAAHYFGSRVNVVVADLGSPSPGSPSAAWRRILDRPIEVALYRLTALFRSLAATESETGKSMFEALHARAWPPAPYGSPRPIDGDDALLRIARCAAADVRAARDGAESTVSAHRTHWPTLTGEEKGRVLVIDWGGTRVKFRVVDLKGGGRYRIRAAEEFAFTPAEKRGPGDRLFDRIAEAAERMAAAEPGVDRAAFVFSFPTAMESLDAGRLTRWTKEMTASGVEGRDVVALLRDALARRGSSLRVAALVNDAACALAGVSYAETRAGAEKAFVLADLGLILGAGVNAAARWPDDVLNLELGFWNLGAALQAADPAAAVAWRNDLSLSQTLEQETASLYVGEALRRLWRRVLPAEGLGPLPALEQPFLIRAEHLSAVTADETKDLAVVRAFAINTLRLPAEALSMERLGRLRETVRAALARSARWVAAAAAGALQAAGDSNRPLLVGVDGSFYANTPGYAAEFERALGASLGVSGPPVRVRYVKDATALGAAVIAAAAPEPSPSTGPSPVGRGSRGGASIALLWILAVLGIGVSLLGLPAEAFPAVGEAWSRGAGGMATIQGGGLFLGMILTPPSGPGRRAPIPRDWLRTGRGRSTAEPAALRPGDLVDGALSAAERRSLADALDGLAPRPFEGMPRLRTLTTLDWMGAPSGSAPTVSEADLEDLARRVGGWGAALREQTVGEGLGADVRVAARSAALLDELDRPWGVNAVPAARAWLGLPRERVAGRPDSRALFVRHYNALRGALWSLRWRERELARRTVRAIDVTPLFDESRGDERSATAVALALVSGSQASGITHLILDGEGFRPAPGETDLASLARAESRLRAVAPALFARRPPGSLRLWVRGTAAGVAVFRPEGLSLAALRRFEAGRPLPLTVYGVAAERVVPEERDLLAAWLVTLVPVATALSPEVEGHLRRLIFLQILA